MLNFKFFFILDIPLCCIGLYYKAAIKQHQQNYSLPFFLNKVHGCIF